VIRIINGIAYEGKSGDTFRVRAHDLGNGHLEASAVRETVWRELDWDATAMECYLDCVKALEDDAAYQAEKAARALRVAANRAKTAVRRSCKVIGASTLLTLTYRHNEEDLMRVKADLKEFNRRLLRLMPDLRFVACFERQQRGAYHVHIATGGIPSAFVKTGVHGLPVRVKSFDAIRAVWRSVTKDRGGNVDVSRRKRHSRSTPAKIAAYISKYVSKDFEDGEKGANRYARYGKFDIPAPIDLGRFENALDAVRAIYEISGDLVVFSQHLSRWGDWFFLHAEPPPKVF
jgi:hypothetical protein